MANLLYLPERLPPPWAARHVERQHADACADCAVRHRWRWPRRLAQLFILLGAVALGAFLGR